MKNFRFTCPTTFVFGKGDEAEAGKEVKKYGTKVLLHYGGGHIKKDGLYDRIVQALKGENLEVYELGGVKANPDIGLVREGISLCKKWKKSMLFLL